MDRGARTPIVNTPLPFIHGPVIKELKMPPLLISRGACDSSLPEEEEVLGRGLFLACESNSQKRSDENQDG